MPGDILGGAGQAGKPGGTNRVGDPHKYDRDSLRLLLECSGRRSRLCEKHVGLQGDQLFRIHTRPISIGAGPTNIDLQVAAVCPTQLRKLLYELRESGLCLRIVFVTAYQHTDLPHAVALLRVCHHWPRHRAPEARDEVPPSHP